MADDDCANPLLLRWLKEWMDEARERNSKGYTVYKKAYQSMRACPLRFDHPAEAQQLNGLGPKLCERLADKLKKHCVDNGLPMPEKSGPKLKRQADHGGDADNAELVTRKKARKAQLYVPKLRSGAYALLMALAELDEDGTEALAKPDLIVSAQPLCDSSFTAPSDPTKFYTAWKSMQTLEAKELVCTRGHPTKRYYLSDEGWEVANRMKTAEGGEAVWQSKRPSDTRNMPDTTSSRSTRTKDNPAILEIGSSPEPEWLPSQGFSTRDDISAGSAWRSDSTLPRSRTVEYSPVVLKPGTFKVQIVLDTREIRTKNDRDYLVQELKKHNVMADIRALPLGDVIWIAKVDELHAADFKLQNSGDSGDGSTEIVLEHVVERKRLDDLIGSLKDGRFHEQKFRLRKSGMRNITYLIEDYSLSMEKGEKYGEAVESAIASMQVVNDIFVKRTSKIDHTISYLARMTKTLCDLYQEKELHVIPSGSLDVSTYLPSLEKLRQFAPDTSFCVTFQDFCSLCDKSDSMTLRDVYLKMLMCTRGVTGDKAVEIQKIWSTPRALIDAYDELGLDQKKKECMISDKLGHAIPRRKVARALSAKIAEVWAG